MTLAGTEQYMAPEGWCSPPDRTVCLSCSLHTRTRTQSFWERTTATSATCSGTWPYPMRVGITLWPIHGALVGLRWRVLVVVNQVRGGAGGDDRPKVSADARSRHVLRLPARRHRGLFPSRLYATLTPEVHKQFGQLVYGPGPPLLKDLTKKCIQYLPKDRPSFKQVRHPYPET
jgi:hypothetical protein